MNVNNQELEILKKSINNKDFRAFFETYEKSSLSFNQAIECIKTHAPSLPSNCLPLLHLDWRVFSSKKILSDCPKSAKIGSWIETIAEQDNQNRIYNATHEKKLEEFFFWTHERPQHLFALNTMYSFDWLDVTWQRTVENQPGSFDSFSTCMYTSNGHPFSIERPDTADANYFKGAAWNFEVRSVFDHCNDEEASQILEEITWELKVRPDQVQHISEHASFIPCQVMRQDDNGNEFEMAQFDSHLKGHWYVADLEKSLHKQTYWVQAL